MSTSRARPRFSKLPKVPLLWAETPPPQAVIPTFIRLIPIKVTTMPDTRGVIILRVYFKMCIRDRNKHLKEHYESNDFCRRTRQPT